MLIVKLTLSELSEKIILKKFQTYFIYLKYFKSIVFKTLPDGCFRYSHQHRADELYNSSFRWMKKVFK